MHTIIENPSPEPLFYIAFTDDIIPIVHHGSICTIHCFETPLPNIEQFSILEYGTEELAEAAYWARLEDFDIYPDPEEEL